MSEVDIDEKRLRAHRINNLGAQLAKAVTELVNADSTAYIDYEDEKDVNLSQLQLGMLDNEEQRQILLMDSIAHCTKSSTLKRLIVAKLALSNSNTGSDRRSNQLLKLFSSAKQLEDDRAERLKEKIMKFAEEQ
ncbi:MAG: hypothetical protein NWF01_06700 [Candidatus Bathyarchaeota archaeon]|nr:hypothetical protein [Candidatus Bathyarchaeota archaeon]